MPFDTGLVVVEGKIESTVRPEVRTVFSYVWASIPRLELQSHLAALWEVALPVAHLACFKTCGAKLVLYAHASVFVE